MRKFFSILFLTMFFLVLSLHPLVAYEKEIKDLSLAMTENIVNAGIKTIAVVDFTDLQGNVTELGRFIAEEFSVALASAGKGFELVDRTHLKSIAQEHKLSITGVIDPKTARELGKIVGVEALLTGVITPFKDSVRLSIKILETNTAKIIVASAGNIARTKAIEELMTKGIEVSSLESPSISPTRTETIQTVERERFLFELKECKLSGKTLTCSFTVTNKSEKDPVGITIYSSRYGDLFEPPGTTHTASWLYDDLGNEYGAKSVTLGQETRDTCVTRTLAPQIPTKFIVQFKDVSPEAKAAVTILVAVNSEELLFRNIPITK